MISFGERGIPFVRTRTNKKNWPAMLQAKQEELEREAKLKLKKLELKKKDELQEKRLQL